MSDNHHHRKRTFVQPPVDTNNLQHHEFMMDVDVIMAGGNQVTLNSLFSGDWPEGFIPAAVAEAQGGTIIEFVRSYQTPRGHINCTRAVEAWVRPVWRDEWSMVRPVCLDEWTLIKLPILEAAQLSILKAQHLPSDISLIMGLPQVTKFMPPNWPYTEGLPSLVRLDFSPRHSYTFPGAPTIYGPMTAGLGDFHNYMPPPPGQQLQVADFPQAGHSTFASAATAGELFREGRTRMWVENNMDNGNNAPSGDVVDG